MSSSTAATANARWARASRRRSSRCSPKPTRRTWRRRKGSRAKLGSLSAATVERNGRKLTIVNGYTQFHWRGSGVLVDYDAMRSVMRRLRESYSACAIGYPKIGAGLAKGDWSTIAAILDEELAGEDHTLVEYEP
jgi:O-acetyl-ADP-ribose deacetylase (regulator of RNase III)